MQHLTDSENWAGGGRRFHNFGMDEGSENFHPVGETRAGPREIAGGVDGKDLAVAHRRQVVPSGRKLRAGVFFRRLFRTIAARHREDHFRLSGKNLLVRNAEGRFAEAPENVNSASAGDHVRYPVPTAIDRIEPLETGNAGPAADDGDGTLDESNARFELRNDRAGFGSAPRGFAYSENVAPHVSQRAGIE